MMRAPLSMYLTVVSAGLAGLIAVPGVSYAGPEPMAASPLPIAPATSGSDYRRSYFGRAWTDAQNAPEGRNGCDTRDDILRLQGVHLVTAPHSCIVLKGLIYDPYDYLWLTYQRKRNNGVDIDHIVPLKWAWRTGAANLSLTQRTELANDPLNLVATLAKVNRSKGDRPINVWQPANRAYWRTYAWRYRQVKLKYHLWVTVSENAALDRLSAV